MLKASLSEVQGCSRLFSKMAVLHQVWSWWHPCPVSAYFYSRPIFLFFMASSSRSEAFYMVNTSRESHMNVEWCNKTQVGYESLLESPPGFGSQELHSSVVDDPNCPLAPSTLKMIEKRLLSQKVQADAQFKTKKA
ncbi:uncharacterized protein LOC124675331 isoform X3 [Lolium rigidum]|uniref:uncharacterized protein LOC124675331 isoform X3 n=1 Tax=Lolium rigidum TaxID=89674 RepID=UPI001F5C1C94|nr:uncharacterized protein LOC124675331 isoform X3 [Lolium rigidum]